MIDDLPLPAAPPLPPEVRQRVLHRVLDELDGEAVPPRRRTHAPYLAAAAAVVTTLLASSVVALAGGAVEIGPSAPPPAQSRPSDPDLRRCAEAVVTAGRTAEYPPLAEWRTTADLLSNPGGEERAVAINDGFACFLGASDVRLTATTGTPVGPLQVVRLAPALLVILNPERTEVRLSDSDEPAGPASRSSSAPVQSVSQGVAFAAPPVGRVTAGYYAGPLPDVGPNLVTVQDRPVNSRAPIPGETTMARLNGCLYDRLGVEYGDGLDWKLVLVRIPGDTADAMVGRVGDGYAGACLLTPDAGVYFVGGPLGSAPGIVAGAPVPAGARTVLVHVPDDTRHVAVEPGGGACDRMYDLALCTVPDGARVVVDGSPIPG